MPNFCLTAPLRLCRGSDELTWKLKCYLREKWFKKVTNPTSFERLKGRVHISKVTKEPYGRSYESKTIPGNKARKEG